MIDFKISKSGFVDVREVAKLVRHTLKESFPGVKFSVTIERYAGGSDLYVKWEDGPTAKQVTDVCAMFKTKKWDSQNECYDYTYRIWQGEKISFGGGGVSPERRLSEAARAEIERLALGRSEETLASYRSCFGRDPAPMELAEFLRLIHSFCETRPSKFLAMWALSQPEKVDG